MRLFPIITSIFVMLGLYVVILERDALRAIAQTEQKTAESSNETPIAEKPSVSVVVRSSVAQSITSGIILRGRTEAARNITVRAETSGLVTSTPLQKGSQVKEGDVLCQLELGTREVNLEQAKTGLREAEKNAANAERLQKRGVGSESATLAARSRLDAARAAVENAQKELERVTISAPFSGLLETDTAETGSLLQPGSPCATILSLDPISIVGFAPETAVGKLKTGGSAMVKLLSGQQLQGQVVFVSKSADALTRTFRVDVEMANPDLTIPDGATAEILIPLAGTKGHLLPQSVLTLNNEGDLGIRADENGMAKFYPVEIVRDSTEGVWVTGLPDAVDVIVTGQDYVVDGRRVLSTKEEAQEDAS